MDFVSWEKPGSTGSNWKWVIYRRDPMWWGMSQGKHELLDFCEQEKTKSICTNNHLFAL
jgi:hypothetical protein